MYGFDANFPSVGMEYEEPYYYICRHTKDGEKLKNTTLEIGDDYHINQHRRIVKAGREMMGKRAHNPFAGGESTFEKYNKKLSTKLSCRQVFVSKLKECRKKKNIFLCLRGIQKCLHAVITTLGYQGVCGLFHLVARRLTSAVEHQFVN